MQALTYDDVTRAANRIAGRIRRVTVAHVDPEPFSTAPSGDLAVDRRQERGQLWLVLEHLQYTGSFKARGAQNFLASHIERGSIPNAGVTIASGGNAGLACAWAAQQRGVAATVFLPTTTPSVKVSRLRGYGSAVHLVGSSYAEALTACEEFANRTGALASHAYDDPLIAAGAGTLLDEIREQISGLDSVVLAVGGGGLFAGVTTAARHHGVRIVAVEPQNSRALNASVEAGRIVDVDVDSIAADSLGARRITQMALSAAQGGAVQSVLVSDSEIIGARRALWNDYRLVVEHGAATALAGLSTPSLTATAVDPLTRGAGDSSPRYTPRPGERVAIVLCGGNTDPSDLVVGIARDEAAAE